MFDFLRKKATCVVINDTSSYYYVDGAPQEIAPFRIYDFYRFYSWDRYNREFSLGFHGLHGTHYAGPKICVSSEKRAWQLFKFIDKLFFAGWDIVRNKCIKQRFKHLFICVKNPVEELYLNELMDSDDVMSGLMLGLYKKNRKKVHIIPNSVCVACEEIK